MHYSTILTLLVNILYCHANILPELHFSGNTWTCREAGMCNGETLSIVDDSDLNKCILRCHESNNGKWSTFNPNNNWCHIFKDCPEIDTSLCKNCVTNQKECNILCKFHFHFWRIFNISMFNLICPFNDSLKTEVWKYYNLIVFLQ